MPKLFIGPYEAGLQKDLEPWMLPNDAFPVLEDAYVWRGRVKKKEAYSFVGRLHTAGVKKSRPSKSATVTSQQLFLWLSEM